MLGTPFARRAAFVVAAIVLALGAVLAARVFPYQVDDSFITYRYAARAAEGLGLTFNDGGPAVEGFSSPAWMGALALVATVGGAGAVPFASVLFDVVFTLFAAFALFRAARHAGAGNALGGSLALAAFALLPSTTFYAVAGLETPAFVACVVVCTAPRAFSRWLLCVVGLLAPFTRPEAPWLAVGLATAAAAAGQLPTLWRRGETRTLLLALLAGGVAMVAWRLLIFGELFPNTFLAKSPDYAAGLRYVTDAFTTPWGALLFCAAALGAIAGGAAFRGFFAAALAWALAVVLEGGDWMPASRLLAPALVLFALAAGGLARAGELSFARARAGARLAVTVLAGLVVAALCVFATLASLEIGDISADTERGLRAEDRALGVFLAKTKVGEAALVDIGENSFVLPRLRIFDLGGLTDKVIARAPGTLLAKRFDRDYLFEQRRPGAIVLRTRRVPPRNARGEIEVRPVDVLADVEAHVASDARLSQRYRAVLTLAPAMKRLPYYGRVVLVRRDLVLPADAIPPQDVVRLAN